MILELDCGNTHYKWRLVDNEARHVSPIKRCETVEEVLASIPRAVDIVRCRLASVRAPEVTASLIQALERQLGVTVEIARASVEVAGVRNGYNEPARLGIDRWLAILGAFEICRGPCLVLDLGTALTVDFVSAEGAHLGGYIAPGFSLMQRQLLGGTSGISLDLAGAGELALPGRSTSAAVSRGCRLMIRSFIAAQIQYAFTLTGEGTAVFVTGGDYQLIADMPGVHAVPDLVFRGLACACP